MIRSDVKRIRGTVLLIRSDASGSTKTVPMIRADLLFGADVDFGGYVSAAAVAQQVFFIVAFVLECVELAGDPPYWHKDHLRVVEIGRASCRERV